MSAAKRRNTRPRTKGVERPTYRDLRQLVGDLEPAKLAEIERIGATIPEVEKAVAWATGESDVMGEARQPLIGRAAEVFEIIRTDRDLEEER